MATTTNYGWTTPDDTALVKDGASAIRTLGSSVDTTTKNLNPSTTLGDIEYRSSTANTNTRLGIGSTGQILTVAGGVPTWAAPAGGAGLVLIHTETFSAVSSVSVNSKFSATYDNYVFKFNNMTSSASDYIAFRLRAGGTDDTGANYRRQLTAYSGTTGTFARTTGLTSWTYLFYMDSTYQNATDFQLSNPFNTKPTVGFGLTGITSAGNIEGVVNYWGLNTSTSYDGFTFFTASGTMTGSISVYGYAK